MKVQILGSGCPSCQKLEKNTADAIEMAGISAEIEKITDYDRIVEMGVMMTPALAIEGEVKSKGKILPIDRIVEILKETKQ